TFPPIPTSNETLRRLINRYAELEAVNSMPFTVYREISRAMNVSDAVEIERIEWQGAGYAVAKDAAGNAPASGAETLPGSKELAILQGTLLLGNESNPRQILAVFNQFVAALKLNPKLEIEVLQQPFDIESAKPLKGGDAVLDARQTHAFKLQIKLAGV
ncbi:MAG TPA: hypothetical protein PLF25_12115, partial [Accumulibacter sp.]|nr:hypothetical protein [Accumulibacter sp.]